MGCVLLLYVYRSGGVAPYSGQWCDSSSSRGPCCSCCQYCGRCSCRRPPCPDQCRPSATSSTDRPTASTLHPTASGPPHTLSPISYGDGSRTGYAEIAQRALNPPRAARRRYRSSVRRGGAQVIDSAMRQRRSWYYDSEAARRAWGW